MGAANSQSYTDAISGACDPCAMVRVTCQDSSELRATGAVDGEGGIVFACVEQLRKQEVRDLRLINRAVTAGQLRRFRAANRQPHSGETC